VGEQFVGGLSDPALAGARRYIDIGWCILLLSYLGYAAHLHASGRLCAWMGVDFRGYYAAAQSAWHEGFSAVYDPQAQARYQQSLHYRCPGNDAAEAVMLVSMPYLPAFVLPFLPLLTLDFTTAYLLFAFSNLVLLWLYLLRFGRAAKVNPSAWSALQWSICIPVMANLHLGQMNTWLVICFGEFTLALLRQRRLRGGAWLSGMLIKPQTLTLLLPGLFFGRAWLAVAGFLLGMGGWLALSVFASGGQGILASIELMGQFAGPLIQTAPGMMNFRALALNLSPWLPGWLAWSIAASGMITVTVFVLRTWHRQAINPAIPGSTGQAEGTVLLLLATGAASGTLAWHSHFYLLMTLIPLLFYLDRRGLLPASLLAAWWFAPPLGYAIFSWAWPGAARSLFGMLMLALSLALAAWALAAFQKTMRQRAPASIE
jgi:hypothetical protein